MKTISPIRFMILIMSMFLPKQNRKIYTDVSYIDICQALANLTPFRAKEISVFTNLV